MVPKSIIRLCKKLKIKVTRRTKSGRRVPKTLKQLRKEIKTKRRNLKGKVLFIQKANKESRRKGTVGMFGKWCKRKKLASKDGKVTMKCIKRGLKDKSINIRRRANFARNIGGYVGYKRVPSVRAFGTKRVPSVRAFGTKRVTSVRAFGTKRVTSTKRNSIGTEKARKRAFGLDKKLFERYSVMDFNVPNSEFPKQTLRKVRRNCEDGESQILFNKIIPGMYVNLGSGKCLSVQEILQMSETGRFLKNNKGEYINPFTRQPLTIRQIIKINDILKASRRPLLGKEFSLMTLHELQASNTNIYQYYEQLINRLVNERLSIQDQKNIINLICELEDSPFRITDSGQNRKWQIVNERLYIMTPDGWILPEHIEEWSLAGMNEREYSAFMDTLDSPRSVLQPRRLFDFGRGK